MALNMLLYRQSLGKLDKKKKSHAQNPSYIYWIVPQSVYCQLTRIFLKIRYAREALIFANILCYIFMFAGNIIIFYFIIF